MKSNILLFSLSDYLNLIILQILENDQKEIQNILGVKMKSNILCFTS